MANLSTTQIDRLGDRLRSGSHSEADLQLLDEYRRSFGNAYEEVVRIVIKRGLSPTGRSAKSTDSIVDKLRRESIRLSQMQDIAGCRVVVTGVVEQERVVASIVDDFPGASTIDRRDNPSHGYRAVHIVAAILGKPIEIQVRTSLQQLWAELSERASDVLDPKIKYGGGPEKWRSILKISSEWVAGYEGLEKTIAGALNVYTTTVQDAANRFLDEQVRQQAEERMLVFQAAENRKLQHAWNETAEHLNRMISSLDDLKGKSQ